jgi:hypothetical protein
MLLRLTCLVLVLMLVFSAPAARADELSWPQELTADGGATVTVYQPQVEEFSGNSLEGRAAVSVKTADVSGTPVFGAIWFEARLDTDRDTRTALIRDVDVVEVRFADATDTQKQQLADLIETELGNARFSMSVDQLLADLDAEAAGTAEPTLRHEPPNILLSTEPALLVLIDGEPVFEEIEGSRYERVVNTPFLVARDGKRHYLYIGSNAWYQASAVSGPWGRAGRVPEDVSRLVEPVEGDDEEAVADARIIIATEPTELIVSAGQPSWSPVEGMNLLYMDNTDSNVFLELSTQRYYVLLSGRWYRSEGVIGELSWTHVPNDDLPAPFGDIPEDSVNGAVLTQVAGTSQAREAVLDNTIPQTAAIKRDDSSFNVEFDGAPEFAPIEEINVEYARNTAAAVFRYGNLYYACDDGVWYVANAATGPWTVATEVPDAIYRIPASNPHHNVTYVRVYDVTPEVVYVGYTPGYFGSYYYRGAVVYGSGWYYNPWYGRYYYPRYPTWGFHVSYNPWYGWGFGVSWTNGPFRFTFSSHGAWWGVGGYRPYPRPYISGGYRKTNININVDNSINIGGNRNRPQNRPNLYNREDNRQRNAARPSTRDIRQARAAPATRNNVLTDRSGNVYQRGSDGSWKQRDDGRWSTPSNLDRATRPAAARPSSTRPSTARPVTRPGEPRMPGGLDRRGRPEAVRPQLERDYNARMQGAYRAQNFERQGQRGRR